MTTNSTNSYSRQDTLSNMPPHLSSSSASNGESAGSRQAPRTRPIVALPPNKLEPVLDVESAVFEDANDEPSRSRSNDRLNTKRSEPNDEYPNDSLWATQSREMPGNRPPMWRQRANDMNNDARCRSCRKGHCDNAHHSREKPKSNRHRSDTSSDNRLLPSKLSFKSSRHHKSETHSTGHSRSSRVVHNSLDSGSTGSSRRYDSRYTTSTDYGDSQYSQYPDASQMNPNDIFYPPGGSFQPYEAKYEPGCYKSSSMSGFHRPKHPPSPPVRDEPIKSDAHPNLPVDEEEENNNRCSSRHRFFNRSSSMQNLSHCEEDFEHSGIRRRLARSASAHRQKAPDEIQRANHRSHAYSSASSLGNEIEAAKSRGRSSRRTETDVSSLDNTDSLYYDSNHNLSRAKSKQESRKTSKCSSADMIMSSRHNSQKQARSCPSETRSRSRDSASTNQVRAISNSVFNT